VADAKGAVSSTGTVTVRRRYASAHWSLKGLILRDAKMNGRTGVNVEAIMPAGRWATGLFG